MNDMFGEVVYSYSYQDALDDGTFIDVSTMAKECGISFPVAVTANLQLSYLLPSEQAKQVSQTYDGRLWDVLWMFRNAAKKSSGNRIEFEVLFANGPLTDGEKGREIVKLIASCGPRSIENPEPVITIFLPEDD